MSERIVLRDVHVRRATLADVEAIRTIAIATWPNAYAAILCTEQIAYMLERMYAADVLSDEISGRHVYLMAEQQGKVLGFAGIEHSHRGTARTKLHKLYVLPDAQGMGVGAALQEQLKASARVHGDQRIELNVNRHNPALATYQKWGFRVAQDVVIDIGNGFVMDDHVMELVLGPVHDPEQ